MRRPQGDRKQSPRAIRAELVARLRKRSPEIEKAILTHIRRLSEPVGDEDPAYLDGLRSAVVEAVSYGLEYMEGGGERSMPIPPDTARQARRAARSGVRLDTVLRRYAAGNKLLEEFIVAEADDVPSRVLCQILRDQGPRVDRLMESVATEYRQELERTRRSSGEKFAHRVLHLLAGDDLEGAADLNYDFDIWHVGMILTGRNAEATARTLAERVGCRSLHIERDHETVWAWLGSTRQPVISGLEHFLVDNVPTEISAAIGEPRRGLEGWRLTHREAQVALQVMLRRPRRLIRGRDVVLLAGVLRDDTLVRSLLDTYLAPLEEHGNSGQLLRETLRAYFSAGGNAAAAAAGLGVTRHTVQRRIRTIEQTIGQLLHTCHAELQVALQLDELKGVTNTRKSVPINH
jgi:PucR C-terminal helix-turn-helix domain/GGDEF-like domain